MSTSPSSASSASPPSSSSAPPPSASPAPPSSASCASVTVIVDAAEHNELCELIAAKALAAFGPGIVEVLSGSMDVADVLLCRTQPRGTDDEQLEGAVERYVRVAGAPARPRDPTLVYVPITADERKEAHDLSGSITTRTDNVPHFHSQKARMRQLRAETGVMLGLLVEGRAAYRKQRESDLEPEALESALGRAQRRDGFHVFESADLAGSAARVVATIACMLEDGIVRASDWTGLSQRSADIGVSVRKAENYTRDWFYRRALVGVLRMSPPIAAAVARRYPTLRSLVHAYDAERAAPERGAALLADVELPDAKRTSTGKCRTLGAALSARTYSLVYDQDAPEKPVKRAKTK